MVAMPETVEERGACCFELRDLGDCGSKVRTSKPAAVDGGVEGMATLTAVPAEEAGACTAMEAAPKDTPPRDTTDDAGERGITSVSADSRPIFTCKENAVNSYRRPTLSRKPLSFPVHVVAGRILLFWAPAQHTDAKPTSSCSCH